ncbi:hypothetical protein [Pseudooctadecabacter jejudonensis]|uniref:Phosphotransferase enzyme family protein n=1 Tax=Pseudooctadecabacter jejudonensis TaxID=1391910 RepID=A0A1Y5S6W3_9RHOB|nr:hypothetical protein [Pseudooctadecabacter jejudonensis]SLN31171.1 hypothetical protein PSJ8397_01435 [Pseudooctadecabacter jejudonensis]
MVLHDIKKRLFIARRQRRARRVLINTIQRLHPHGSNSSWHIRHLTSRGHARGPRDLFRCIAPNGEPMIAKVYSERAAVEASFQVLVETAQFTDQLVQPILCDADTGVLLMEDAGNADLQSQIGTPQQTRMMQQAGAWLATFHGRGGVRQARFTQTAEMPIPPAQQTKLRPVFEKLHTREQDVLGRAVTVAQTFGDFKPENLILSQRGLLGIDRPLHETAPREQDLAFFLFCTQRVGFTSDPSLARFAEGRAAFLNAYGYPERDAPLLDQVLDLISVRQWMYRSGRADTPAAHQAFYDDWIARQHRD